VPFLADNYVTFKTTINHARRQLKIVVNAKTICRDWMRCVRNARDASGSLKTSATGLQLRQRQTAIYSKRRRCFATATVAAAAAATIRISHHLSQYRMWIAKEVVVWRRYIETAATRRSLALVHLSATGTWFTYVRRLSNVWLAASVKQETQIYQILFAQLKRNDARSQNTACSHMTISPFSYDGVLPEIK